MTVEAPAPANMPASLVNMAQSAKELWEGRREFGHPPHFLVMNIPSGTLRAAGRFLRVLPGRCL